MSKNRAILIVDDEVNVLKSLSRALKTTEFDVISTDEPKKAIEILYQRNDIDVIISDFNMPHMNGIELLTEVKELFPHVQRFILSAYQDFNVIVKALNEGIIHKYCAKPWDPEDLKVKIRQALGARIHYKDNITYDESTESLSDTSQILFLEQLDTTINQSNSKFAVILVSLKNTKELYLSLGLKQYQEFFRMLTHRIGDFYSNQYFFKRLNESSVGIMVSITDKKNEDFIIKELTQLYEFLEQPVLVANRTVVAEVNCGIAFYPDHGHSAEYLTRNAQEAMYNSISRNRKLEVYRPEFRSE
ncbi:MAG: response regulator [Gammaproteobacteria bacterium]